MFRCVGRAANPSMAAASARQTLSYFLRPRVAGKFWLPDAVVFLEAVPKTSVGKFDKKVLRKRFKGLATAGVNLWPFLLILPVVLHTDHVYLQLEPGTGAAAGVCCSTGLAALRDITETSLCFCFAFKRKFAYADSPLPDGRGTRSVSRLA